MQEFHVKIKNKAYGYHNLLHILSKLSSMLTTTIKKDRNPDYGFLSFAICINIAKFYKSS